ncbi:MAG: carboxypeptidase-like regulatory domain-containing protein [Bacteroidota bacterium]
MSSAILLAQGVINGKVIDQQTGTPLASANVFLNNSQNGAISDINGNFEVYSSVGDSLEVFVSFIGYVTRKLKLKPGSSTDIIISLTPSDIVMKEQVINSTVDKSWQRKLKKFKIAFFGSGEFATKCEIINPWVLEFKMEKGDLTATTNGQVLSVENLALGYKVNYLLDSFSHNFSITAYKGLAGFQELEPKNSSQYKKWINNRKKAYQGSLRHFMKCILEGTEEDNGYTAFIGSPSERQYGMKFVQSQVKAKKKNIFKNDFLSFKNSLVINYFNELTAGTIQQSVLQSLKPTKVYPNGELKDPYAIKLRGNMANEGFAYFLPMEYNQPENEKGVVRFYQDIVKPFVKYQENYPLEKIHLHTDKSLYFPKETIWLKGYMNTADEASSLSSKLFIQFQGKDSILIRTVAEVHDGVSVGSIELPADIPNGEYLLSANTDWSDTLASAFHFHKKIQVGVSKSAEGDSIRLKAKYKVYLYPEGGNFIAGENSFAFEVRDQHNRLMNQDIEIYTNEGVVSNYKSIWQGKGRGTINIQSGKNYYARTVSNPSETTPLVVLTNSGIGLQIKKIDSTYNIKMRKSGIGKENFHSLLVSDNRVIFYDYVSLDSCHTAKISASLLSQGVNQLIIFDEKRRPIAERLIFKKPSIPQVIPKFKITQKVYEKRSFIKLQINSAEHIRDASIAAIDLSQTQESGEENILISHYLRPWIRGSITGLENLHANGQEPRLDLLMMTNGWSRYNWQNHYMHQHDAVKSVALQTGFDIKGQVVSRVSKQPLPITPIILLSSESGILSTVSDTEGRFNFRNVYFNDSTRIIFKIDAKRTGKDHEFIIDSLHWNDYIFPQSAVVKDVPIPAKLLTDNYELNKKLSEVYDFDGKTFYLKDVIIQAEREDPYKFDQSPFSSPFNQKVIIDSLNLGATPTTFDILTRCFRGVRAISNQSKNTLSLVTNIFVDGRVPLVTIDNGLATIGDVKVLPVSTIHSIEVLRGNEAAILGRGGIFIVTKKVLAETKKKKSVDFAFLNLKGFQKYKEFYNPGYSTKQVPYIPDRRSTLYWNPDITSASESLLFYNHDNPTTVKVIMEGFAKDGEPFRQTGYYEIRN